MLGFRHVQAMVLMGGHGALAADASDLPPIDQPSHWRVLTQDDSTSDSKCIGKPVTPLCAVETIRACFVREDDSLCQIGMGLDHLPGLIHLIDREGLVGLGERYRIVAAAKIGKKKRSPINGERPEAGDVLVDVIDLYCRGQKCSRSSSRPTTYLMRHQEERWIVLTWDTPRGD